MILIKQNLEKRRKVYKENNKYIKIWDDIQPSWISNHVKLLREYCPELINDYSDNWISYNEIEGTPVSKLEHSNELIDKVYEFCLGSLLKTKPYVHGDWVVSNIIMKPDNSFYLIDWDNIGIYSETEVMTKLHNDLHSSFGDKFYDATGI
jgi:RIO-like serine/threonine protein kinase